MEACACRCRTRLRFPIRAFGQTTAHPINLAVSKIILALADRKQLLIRTPPVQSGKSLIPSCEHPESPFTAHEVGASQGRALFCDRTHDLIHSSLTFTDYLKRPQSSPSRIWSSRGHLNSAFGRGPGQTAVDIDPAFTGLALAAGPSGYTVVPNHATVSAGGKKSLGVARETHRLRVATAVSFNFGCSKCRQKWNPRFSNAISVAA